MNTWATVGHRRLRGGLLAAGVALALNGTAVLAKATPEEAARLGKDLTAVGAERAANAAGTIPEFRGRPAFGDAQIRMTREQLEQLRTRLVKDIERLVGEGKVVAQILIEAQGVMERNPARANQVIDVVAGMLSADPELKAEFDKILTGLGGKTVDGLIAGVRSKRIKISDLVPDINAVIAEFRGRRNGLSQLVRAFDASKVLGLAQLMDDPATGKSGMDLLLQYMPPFVLDFLSFNVPGRAPQDFLKPLYTITPQNYEQHLPVLSEGHIAMFKAYPTFKMIVYPSVRNAFFPPQVEAATIANATTATISGTDDVQNARTGFPFPIPKTGPEPIWNHKLKFRGSTIQRYNNQAIVKPDGSFIITKLVEDIKFVYGNLKEPPEPGERMIAYYLQETKEPPRVAGQITLVHEKIGPGVTARSAWLFSPGLSRVNRAPDVGYDNPAIGSDAMQFYDQVDVYNGALDRYTWKLVGKREVLIPYNNWIENSPTFRYADLIRPWHVNQDLVRYELHRVWVVEATLRPGNRHLFKKRRFYLDEDSWSIALVDCYDNRDQLWKVQEAHLVTIPFIPTVSGIPEVIYDLQNKRYFLTTMTNEDPISDFEIRYDDSVFTPNALQRRASRR